MFSKIRLSAGVSLGVLLLLPIAANSASFTGPSFPKILGTHIAGGNQRFAEFAKMHPMKKGAFGGYYMLTADSFIYGSEGSICSDFSAPSSGGFGSWSATSPPYSGTYYLSGKMLRVWGSFYDPSGSAHYIVDAQGKLKGKGAVGGYDEGTENGEMVDLGTVTLSPPSSASCPPPG